MLVWMLACVPDPSAPDDARAFVPTDDGYRATVGDLSARVHDAGAELAVGTDRITVSSGASGWVVREDSLASAGDRTEWWIARAGGFEQGWTVRTPGEATIDLVVDGAEAVTRPHEVRLHGDDGATVLVSALLAWDADGKHLPARFEPHERGFRVRVDEAGARYPITVDPLYTAPSWIVDGLQADDFGEAISAGDFDGDGYDDLVVGAPDTAAETGVVYVYLGSSSGTSVVPALTLSGTDPVGAFGTSVAALDADGDGYDDLLVGAYKRDSYRGAAFLFLGSAAGLSSVSVATLEGENGSDYFGEALARAGDLNGDGYDDAIVGANGWSNVRGRAYVYLGSSAGLSVVPSTTLTGEADGQYFGGEVAGAGDLNGDGYDDLLVNATGWGGFLGRVYVHHGSASGVSSVPTTTREGSVIEAFGRSIAAGDVNGDGFDDLIAGSDSYASFAGRAFVYLGGVSGLEATPSTTIGGGVLAEDRFGAEAAAGDLNGDGFDDVVISATGAGEVTVYDGSAGGVGTVPTATLTGTQWGFARTLATGDVNGDGIDELLMASGGAQVGVFAGTPGGVSTVGDPLLDGVVSSEDLGRAVSRAGDVNGDGYDDVIVGGPGSQDNAGRVYVFHGSASGLPVVANTIFTGAPGESLGCELSDAGDVNGDGFDDVVFGGCMFEDGGGASVHHGSAAGLITTPARFVACWDCSVAGAGDVNGDGFDDVVLADETSLAAYIHLGGAGGISATPATTLVGEVGDDDFGRSADGAGDVNGDGFADVVVGGDGRTYVFHGSTIGAATPWATLADRALDDDQARQVSGAGDVNGDGYDDVIAGVPSGRYEPYDNRALVYLGGPSGVSPVASVTLEEGFNLTFGTSVSSAGDLDADGYDDVIVGCPPSYSGYGSAFVFRGSPAGVSPTADYELTVGVTEHDAFGDSVSGAGDVDGDGYDDVIVGAPYDNYYAGRAYLYRGHGEDADGDGFPVPVDCDDTNPAVHPGASDAPGDGVDQDCDGDDGCFADDDGDGWGSTVPASCEVGVTNAIDCDDANPAVSPTAPEVCNTVDDDCDGDVDDADPDLVDAVTWFADADADGFGDPAAAVEGCVTPPGFVASADDCDDTDPTVNPGAEDVPNDGVDQDCDGEDAVGPGCGGCTGSAGFPLTAVFALGLLGRRRLR